MSAPTSRTRAHGARVRVGGLVVARQRPGTAKGVVFLLLEDEGGTLNPVVPPQVYERDRLAVRTEPLVMVEGKLERFASAGGAINVLADRIVALDAPDRVAAEVKDFSPLDLRELERQAEEGSLAAAAAGGGRGRLPRRGPARHELRPGPGAMTAPGTRACGGDGARRPARTAAASAPSGLPDRRRGR